jgi:hypothetical protein
VHLRGRGKSVGIIEGIGIRKHVFDATREFKIDRAVILDPRFLVLLFESGKVLPSIRLFSQFSLPMRLVLIRSPGF